MPRFPRRIFLAAAALFLTLFSYPACAQTKPAEEPLRILFIGNSLTSVNDLPQMLAQLAAAGHQRPLSFEQETPGGVTLQQQWNAGTALAKIRSHPWDIVVLQEQSTFPLTNRNAFFEYAKKFDAEIKKQNATTLLYMTWALQDQPETQTALTAAYLDLAQDLHAPVAPVGQAWQAALLADKTLTLHQGDKKHPQPAGTYLAACVFYATLYHLSPEGLPGTPAQLTATQTRPLQTIAWKIVQAQSATQPAATSASAPAK